MKPTRGIKRSLSGLYPELLLGGGLTYSEVHVTLHCTALRSISPGLLEGNVLEAVLISERTQSIHVRMIIQFQKGHTLRITSFNSCTNSELTVHVIVWLFLGSIFH